MTYLDKDTVFTTRETLNTGQNWRSYIPGHRKLETERNVVEKIVTGCRKIRRTGVGSKKLTQKTWVSGNVTDFTKMKTIKTC